jgi:hypothetical protein
MVWVPQHRPPRFANSERAITRLGLGSHLSHSGYMLSIRYLATPLRFSKPRWREHVAAGSGRDDDRSSTGLSNNEMQRTRHGNAASLAADLSVRRTCRSAMMPPDDG